MKLVNVYSSGDRSLTQITTAKENEKETEDKTPVTVTYVQAT